MEHIIIQDINTFENKLLITFNFSSGLRKFFNNNGIFAAEFNFELSDIPKSILVVPILTNLLQFSWLTNSMIWVNELDKNFYDSIQGLKSIFREIYPNVNIGGSIIVAKQIDNFYIFEKSALQLFTGGIDATTTLLRIIDKKPILVNVNGWLDDNLNEVISNITEKESIKKIAQDRNLKCNFVKSNFSTFINHKIVNLNFGKKTGTSWWFGFQHSLAFLGCSAVIGYHFKVDKLYIASSYTFGQEIRCVSDPRIDTLFKCSVMSTVHDGYELSRQDKVKYILDYSKVNNEKINLRVCSFNDHNCCNCEKCFRSMLALIAEGADELSDYGFFIDKPFYNALLDFLENHAMEIDRDHIVFWNDIISKMHLNVDILKHEDVYLFLKNYNFKKSIRKSIIKYYKNNFASIILRKLKLNKNNRE